MSKRTEAKRILEELHTYLDIEIQQGRRMVSLDPAVVQSFLTRKTVSLPKPAPAVLSKRAVPVAKSESVPVAAGAAALAERASGSPVEQAEKTVSARVAGAQSLEEIAAAVCTCGACHLAKTRQKAVPGVGNGASPDILFVGEAPGADEDKQGEPFVGRAGQLLTKMIAAMGYTREQVFIANIIKCRPPENRTPTPDEMTVCLPYLKQQISLIRPKTIIALGATACKGLLGQGVTISSIRGIWQQFGGIPLMPTFHPAYLLRVPSAKAAAWEDLKKVLSKLGRPVPAPTKKQV